MPLALHVDEFAFRRKNFERMVDFLALGSFANFSWSLLSHGALATALFRSLLLKLLFLAIDLFAKLCCTGLILHNLLVKVGALAILNLVLVLLIHLLLLSVESLLSSMCRCVCC